MATHNSDNDRSMRPMRLLSRGLGLAAAVALATGGVAAAATSQEASLPSGISAPAAVTAAAPSGGGFLRGSNVKATPRITNGGGIVTVTGEAPLNARTGEWITIVSNAFVSKAKLEGLPAIRTQVLVNGKYAVKATVRGDLKSGAYVIAGRYKGRPFESWTSVTVRPYSTVMATPRIVSGGQRVTISGEGPRNAPTGQWITLMSVAFASRTTVNGIPAIRTQVLVNGKYSVTAAIAAGLRPTTYAVAGSYKGQPLETVAWITVR
jgi:hypothetical protein